MDNPGCCKTNLVPADIVIKDMKKICFLSVIILLLYGSACEKMMEHKYTVMLDNKSVTRLYAAVGMTGEGTAGIYPDTSLPARVPIFSTITPRSVGYIIYSSINIEAIFEKELPKDTLSVYLFDADNVDASSWNTIQSQNKVLKRYDLSLQDLQQANFIITYNK
jgi:hypothetical protein